MFIPYFKYHQLMAMKEVSLNIRLPDSVFIIFLYMLLNNV